MSSPSRRPRPAVAAPFRRSMVVLALVLCTALPSGAQAPAPGGIEIEPAARALARLDSLMAIVRAEEARIRPALGLEGNWTRLARAWFQVGDHARAARCVQRAQAIGAKEFDTALLSGRVARSEGRFAEAIEWLERAGRLRTDDWELHEDLGLACYLDGRLTRAADHWERARALPGSGSPDRSGLVEAMRRVGARPYEVTGRGRERLRFVPQGARGPLVVPVRINGRGPFLFRIDAGSPEVTIEGALARELGLVRLAGGGPGSVAGAIGIELDYSTIDSLTLDGTTLHRLPVAVTGARRDDLPGAVRGMIGFEVLRRFRFCIDLPDSSLWLEPPGSASEDPAVQRPAWAPAGAVMRRVPILLRGTHLLVAYGRLGGGPERPFLIEPGGSGVALSAPASTIAEAGIVLDTSRVMSGTSAAGGVRFIGFAIDTLCVGDACRTSLDGAYGTFPPRLESNPSFRLAGIVSGGFLSGYRVGVDLARRELLLIERE